MLKLIEIDSSFYHDEPTVSILDFDTSRGMIKRAADDRITQYASNIQSDPNKIYVHILAMGAGEYYGANRNADYFPEENLLQYYKTFETTPAHIFKHHVNKDPNIAIGRVIFAVYNERMHRVEVIAWIDRIKGSDYVAKIERGEFPSTSMACHTPFDTCAICGNQARSRAEYCRHLTSELGRVYPDGRKSMALNNGALKFFDMSMVFRPADVTSSVLQKLAETSNVSVGSAELAEQEGLTEKSAAIKKLSELIKEVEGDCVSSSASLDKILARVKDPDDEVLQFLVHYDIHHILHALAELGISPSIGFFARLIGRKICGEDVEGIENLVSGLLQEDGGKLDVPITSDPEPNALTKSAILSILTPFVKSASLFPEIITQRSASVDSMFPDFTSVRPINTGYTVSPGSNYAFSPAPDVTQYYRNLVQQEQQREQTQNQPDQVQAQPGLLRTLFNIAGYAVAAKWLLSKMIESRMKEVMAAKAQNSMPAVKIILVKSASEAVTTNQLAKASLLRALYGR